MKTPLTMQERRSRPSYEMQVFSPLQDRGHIGRSPSAVIAERPVAERRAVP